MKLAIASAIVALANIAALPYALDTSNDADRAYVETVKADLYEQSEQAANARHANEFLAKTYKDIDDE